ncbi:MAG: hypothetical protein LBC61_01705 [Candidatus Peribacteria bacterium]|nr:hypothetical protein [Candidatus Peribacteria bacterium]
MVTLFWSPLSLQANLIQGVTISNPSQNTALSISASCAEQTTQSAPASKASFVNLSTVCLAVSPNIL